MLKRIIVIFGLMLGSLGCVAQNQEDLTFMEEFRIDTIIQHTTSLMQQQRYDVAEKYLSEKKDIFVRNTYCCIFYNLFAGILNAYEKNISQAQSYFVEAFNIIEKDRNKYIEMHDSVLLSVYYYYALSFESTDRERALSLYIDAKKYYEMASLKNTDIYKQIIEAIRYLKRENKEGKDVSKLIEDIQYNLQHNNDKAILYLNRLLKKAEDYHDDVKCEIYCLLGRSLYVNKNFQMADSIYMLGEKLAKTLPRNIPAVRHMYTEIGGYYSSLYNYDKSMYYLMTAKYLYEQNHDLDGMYVTCLNNIIVSLLGQNNSEYNNIIIKSYLDVSIKYALRMLEIEGMIGTLNWLYQAGSVFYERIGCYDIAMEYILKSQSLNEESKETLSGQFNTLAILSMRKHNYVDAQKYSYRAYQLSKNSLFAFHKKILMNCITSQYLNNNINYVKYANILINGIQDEVLDAFLFLSSNQRSRYWDDALIYIYQLSTFLYESKNYESYGSLYNQLLFAKGLLLRTSNLINEHVGQVASSEDRNLLTNMTRLQNLLIEGKLPNDSIELIKTDISKIEKTLMKHNIRYNDVKNNLLYDWNKIRKSLKKDEKAIEFIQLLGFNKESLLFDTVKYAAIVVDSKSKYPQIIPLCTDDTLRSIFDRDITTISTSGKKSQLNRYVTNIYSTKNPRFMNGEELYSLVWEPLEEAIGDAKTIYYSTSGLLNSVSFAAISHENISLCDRYNMVYLSSTAEVPNQKKRKKMKMNDAMVYGGISYSTPKEEMVMASQKYQDSVSSTMMVARGENRGALVDLEGTYKEAMYINEYLNTKHISSTIMSGSQANEESFKALDGKSPSLIHLATHGFFMSDPKTVAMSPFMQSHQVEITTMDNALERAGLCFSGANYAWMGDSVDSNIEDGILTAEELSYMDLSNTELVVLSACETGLGESMVSEGIFGLQRAFKLAGVKSLVMSLWKVDDKATAEFMRLFYEKWLSGTPRREAFNEAQREMKQMKGYESPYYWAGFVMMD